MKARHLKYFFDGMGGIIYPCFVPDAKSRAGSAGWESAARSWERIGQSMWAVLGEAQEETARTHK